MTGLNERPDQSPTHFLALIANVVSIFPHGVLQRFLVELGGGGSDGLAVHQVLVLQAHQTLALDVFVQIIHWAQHICKLGVTNWSVLGRNDCVQ